MLKVLAGVFVLAICLTNIKSQILKENQLLLVTENSSCDITEADLSIVFFNFEKNSLKESSLIIIGKGAKREKKIYNSKRISTIAETFKRFGISEEKIVRAEATPKDEFGYIEVFVNGQLALLMRTLRRKNFCTFCCEEPATKTLKPTTKKQRKMR